jgi:hypothetical protein
MLNLACPGIRPATFTRVPTRATTRRSRIAPAGSETSTRFMLAPAGVRTSMLSDRPAAGSPLATLEQARNMMPAVPTPTRSLRMVSIRLASPGRSPSRRIQPAKRRTGECTVNVAVPKGLALILRPSRGPIGPKPVTLTDT